MARPARPGTGRRHARTGRLNRDEYPFKVILPCAALRSLEWVVMMYYFGDNLYRRIKNS